MKNIQPIPIWKNGEIKQANNLELAIISDNLATTATFYYQLLSVETEFTEGLADGNLVIDGTDYQNWGDTEDINTEAYTFCAGKLGLTIL